MVDFATIETDLFYKIEHGRVNPIHVNEGSRPLPVWPPTAVRVSNGPTVIKWNLKHQTPTEQPHWIRLTLFRKKSSVTDESILYRPPVGLPDTVRFPSGNDTNPTREHSEIWTQWIAPNWEPIDGSADELTGSIFQAEKNNTDFPGLRKSIIWRNPVYPDGSVISVEPRPLRVASVYSTDGGYALLLLEIKRKGRLRLLWRPVFIKATKCFIATAAYGSHLSPEVQFLRSVRDAWVRNSSIGKHVMEEAEKIYYKLSPNLAELMQHNTGLKSIIRFLLVSPIVKGLQFFAKLVKKITAIKKER